ncbi:MFS transporter [Actinomadura darangshiensis]|uniref:MFS transporter n=1 Tax=Actinomadura darangshiensis TaxID=705336 RepID=A0A4R5A6G1_9ACTN|nr:MFS transporter [Actinomadura darangshiensis]TDD66389.1 MFS transporter [Actinomadura darangshiensis]
MAQRNQWWPVIGCGLVVFMATLDTSIVNVALPVIERDFGVPTSATEWVVLGYLLPLIALTLPAGRWLDRTGPRAALLLAMGGFTLASAAAGAAPALPYLVAARVVQGAFAAILFAVIPSITVRAVRPDLAGRAGALVMTLGPLGAVSGPPLGGLIVQAWGWPWIFYINVPAGAVVALIALTSLAPDALRPPGRAFAAETVLLGGAAAALLLALSLSASHGPAWLVLAPAAAPPLLLWWRTRSSGPVRALMRVRAAAAPVQAILLNAVLISVVEFLAPFYLQRTLHLSPVATATAILALPVALVAAGPLGGFLGDRWGTSRTAALGAAVATAGALLLVPASAAWQPADLSWRLAVIGAGTGLLAGPSFTMLMSSASDALQGTAGAAQSLARQLGFSLGPALATTTWSLTDYTLPGIRTAFALAALTGLTAVLVLARNSPERKVRAVAARHDEPSAR